MKVCHSSSEHRDICSLISTQTALFGAPTFLLFINPTLVHLLLQAFPSLVPPSPISVVQQAKPGAALTICGVHTSASADKRFWPTGCAGRVSRLRESWRWGFGGLPRPLSLATPQARLGHAETLGLLQLPVVNLQKTSKWPAAKAP